MLQEIGVYELYSRYISINLGKLPLESENAWLCSPPHSSRGKSLVAMGFQGCPAACRKCLTPSTPRRARLVNHPAPGRGACVQSICCAKPQFGQKGGPLADCRTKFPSPLPFTAKKFNEFGWHLSPRKNKTTMPIAFFQRSLANLKQYVMVWLNSIEKPTIINGNFPYIGLI